jgi:acyl-CoA reductase-like NAD-dependent aldehyde dehydrogenase
MESEPHVWKNFSPGDLSFSFPEAETGEVALLVERSVAAFPGWAALPLAARREALERCRVALQGKSDELAVLIARETGKPLREARLEMEAVVAAFDPTFIGGEIHLGEVPVEGGSHSGIIRQRPRGPAAVLSPFSFPIQLGHGAVLAYLLAGNTVVFKPSPLAVNTGLAYARIMQSELPANVFQFLAGWGKTGRALCLDSAVRSVSFTGSASVGRRLARELAEDTSKSLVLELGGGNSVIVCADADLDLAADAVADGMCLSSGQRCNATARVLVHRRVAKVFLDRLAASLVRYQPGDPLDEETLLGPLVSFSALDRYECLISNWTGEWIVPGGILEKNAREQHGYYVLPAVMLAEDVCSLDASPFAMQETFAPVIVVEMFDDEGGAIARHGAWRLGLATSIFTSDDTLFARFGTRIAAGNLYRNLPTTLSPLVPPFDGRCGAGNARGFLRFATQEQSVQWKS